MGKKKHVRSKPTDEPEVDFETALAKLEQVVADLEQGRLGLSESLARYEEGVRHLKWCYQLLEDAEKKIALLRGVDANGNVVTEPFDEADMESLIDKSEARSRRRSKPPRPVSPAPTNPPEADDVDLSGGLF